MSDEPKDASGESIRSLILFVAVVALALWIGKGCVQPKPPVVPPPPPEVKPEPEKPKPKRPT